MKRILLLLICMGWLAGFAQVASKQGTRNYYEVPNRNTAFTTSLGVGQLVLQADSVRWVYLTHLVQPGWKLDTVYKSGWWRHADDVFWTNNDFGRIENRDTTKSFTFRQYNGSSYGYLYVNSSNIDLVTGYNDTFKRPDTFDPVSRIKTSAFSMSSGIYGSDVGAILMGERYGDDYSYAGFYPGTGRYGAIYGQSSFNGNERLNLGYDDLPMGDIYAGTLHTDGNIIINSLGQLTGDADTCVYFDWVDHKLKRKSIAKSPWEINEGWVRPLIQNQGVNIGWSTYDSLLSVNGGAHITRGLKVDKTIAALGGTSTNWNTAYSWGNHAGLYWLKSDTATTLLSRTRAASTYAPKSTVSSQWTTGGSNIYFNGNVGIGTTNPSVGLEMGPSKPVIKLPSNGAIYLGGVLMFNSTTHYLWQAPQSGQDWVYYNYSGTELIRFKNSGNIGIGTTNPTYRVHVISKKADAFAVTTKNDGSLGDSSIIVTAGGLVGIGVTNPTSQCEIQTNTDRIPLRVKHYPGTEGIPADLPTYVTSCFIRNVTNAYGNLCTYLGGSNSYTGLTFGDKDSYNAGSILYYNSDNSLRFRINGSDNKLYINSSGNVGIGTTTPSGILAFDGTSSQSVLMERNTITNTAGNNLTLQAGGATSGATDKDGGSFNVSPGTSTGKGKSSVKLRRLARSNIATTSDNSFSDAFIVMSEKNLSNNVDDSVFTISLPNLGITGVTVTYSVVSGDGTDVQSISGDVHIAAVRKSGTVTSTNTVYESGEACSTGTLTTRWTVSATTWHVNNNKVTIKLNANSSLTPTTLKLYYTIHNGSTQTITQL